MIHFAYDGSINGDWVSHYAIQLAAAHAAHRLQIIHVNEPDEDEAILSRKLQHIHDECARLEVDCQLRQLSVGTVDVAQLILAEVPAGPDRYLVCGTRVRRRKRGYLRGTVSQALIKAAQCHVLALRVVNPGLLGLPRRLLLPVSGHPRGFRCGLPFLRLFGPQLSQLHLLHVVAGGPHTGLWRSQVAIQAARRQGEEYCRRIEAEIAGQLGLGQLITDAQVVVGNDVPHEIVVAADKTKSRLIYLGASERSRLSRLFHGDPVEQILKTTNCDVAVYRGVE